MNLSIEALLALFVVAAILHTNLGAHAQLRSHSADALLEDLTIVTLKGYAGEAMELHSGNARGMQELADEIERELKRCVQFESNGHSTHECRGNYREKELFFFGNEIFRVELRVFE